MAQFIIVICAVATMHKGGKWPSTPSLFQLLAVLLLLLC
jgi:hypothetical protein